MTANHNIKAETAFSGNANVPGKFAAWGSVIGMGILPAAR
jgi:hypothetical protein